MKEKVDVVMLPTEKASSIVFRENRLMFQNKKSAKNDRKWMYNKYYHLYFLSDKAKHKFNVGDWVKIVEPGYGCSPECIGEVVQILELGLYNNKGLGYKTTKTKNSSNAITGASGGFIGEKSFKLADVPEKSLSEASSMLIVLV